MTREASDHLKLVGQARAGNAEALAALAEQVRERVYAYIHRVTLRAAIAADLTQDTLVSVLESLGALKQTERFWPWVFRIATNKIHQHYRDEARRRTVPMTEPTSLGSSSLGESGDTLSSLADEELARLTRVALEGVSQRHRAVLVMRFFEDLPHTEIARILKCSELATRAALFRAKSALAHELKRRGVSSSMLGAAILAFGQTTVWPGSASAVTVSASALAESLVAALLSMKVKAVATVAAAFAVVCGLVWWAPSQASSTAASGQPVRWVHFTRHSYEAVSDPIRGSQVRSQGIFEHWYHFPEGLGGPMMLRIQRWDPTEHKKLCWWVENGDANYYIHSGESTVYIRNAHLTSSSGMTKSLPTDPLEFAGFIRGVEGEESVTLVDRPGWTFQRDEQTGFVVNHEDNRFPELGTHRSQYDYTDQDIHLFDAPTGMKIVDHRDSMHKRGWTYFEVEGKIDSQRITGYGCLPLVHNASEKHPAWLRLEVDGQESWVDDGRVACHLNGSGRVIAATVGGTLFRGLARPWMGWHTVDTIRRDAAAERIWFSTQEIEPGHQVRVTLVDDHTDMHHMLRYTVDMQRDLLERIEIWQGPRGLFEEQVGELAFRYDDQVTRQAEELSQPRLDPVPESATCQKATVLWPLFLLKPTASRIAAADRMPATVR